MRINGILIGTCLAASALMCVCAVGHAEEVFLPRIDVIGSTQEDMQNIAGAMTVISHDDLKRLQPASTEDALRTVSGLVTKPEEESAIVANIGMRGLSASEYKTLVLEDGVPVAPDLFFGNSRYYNPRIQRMESIEVLKGAASLRYGPNTIGGVINYKTKDPQEGTNFGIKLGSHQYKEASFETGLRSASGDALAGLFVTTANSNGFQNKGYEMQDIMVKAGTVLNSNQWLGVKYTHYENDANISYRGLFINDYKAGATYNPAPDDWFLTSRDSLDINHEYEIDGQSRINTVVYWSQMQRDYWRFDIHAASSLSNGRWNFDTTNDGNTANDIVYGNNRAFDRVGVDSRIHLKYSRWGLSNEAEIGIRWMQESMADQKIAATRASPRSGTLSSNVNQFADSWALFAQNTFILNASTSLTPGLRIEQYRQVTDDLITNSKDGTASNTEVLPGIGLTHHLNAQLQIYAGAYKAFSPAYNSTSIVSGADLNLGAERSTNIELGLRGQAKRISYEATLFQMNFDNQVIRANSNGGDPSNAGKTLHQGLELSASYVQAGFGVRANATYIPVSKFIGTRYASTGSVEALDGNRITYSPKWVANLMFNHDHGPWKTGLGIHHVGSQYTDSANTTNLTEATSGFFTGKIDAYTTTDANLQYEVDKQLSMTAVIRNIANKRYIASLRQGIYAGPERSFELGAKYKF